MKKTAHVLIILILFTLLLSRFTSSHALAQVFPGPETRNISVSAVIPPIISDFQFGFNIETSQVHQDQTLTYEILYGASASAGLTTTNTIVVNYSSDKAPDKSYLVEYVSGSASKGYGGAQPVIDPINRTITWKVTLPEGVMNQRLTFQLRTNDSYRDAKERVTFTNRVDMRNEYVTMAQLARNQDYLFDPTRVKPGPTAIPTPNVSPTPTVTPAQLRIYDLSFRKINESEASVAITTSNPVRTIIRYGTDPAKLDQTAQSNQFATYSTVELTGLQPEKIYYLQATIIDRTGRSFRSEIYTFETAQSAQQIVQGKDAYVITSDNTIILSNILEPNTESAAFALLLTNTSYQLVYTFETAQNIKAMDVIVRGKNGIAQRVQMTQKDSKTYIAQLRTTTEGTYNLEVHQTDDKDNLISRKISTLKIISPIRVLELGTTNAVIDARVFVSVFNPKNNRYEPMENVLVKNPTFTDTNGAVHFILQQGRYQIEVSAFGYQSKTVTFSLGPNDGETFPVVRLQSNPFDVVSFFNYTSTLVKDSVSALITTLHSLANSIRAFAAVATTTITSSVGLSFLLFQMRTNIRLGDLIPFFLFHVAVMRNKHHQEYLYGAVIGPDGNPVSGVRIEIMLAANTVVLSHTTSNRTGGFRIENDFEHPYIKLRITKEGYPEIEMIVPTDQEKPIKIRLDRKGKKLPSAAVTELKHVSGGFFEIVLIGCLLLELLFLEAFGVAKTLPFIVLTFFNLALWIFYQREHKLHQ